MGTVHWRIPFESVSPWRAQTGAILENRYRVIKLMRKILTEPPKTTYFSMFWLIANETHISGPVF